MTSRYVDKAQRHIFEPLVKPSRKVRPPIPAPQRHRDEKNGYRRQPKHPRREQA